MLRKRDRWAASRQLCACSCIADNSTNKRLESSGDGAFLWKGQIRSAAVTASAAHVRPIKVDACIGAGVGAY